MADLGRANKDEILKGLRQQKVYDPYAAGTPTVAAQNAQGNAWGAAGGFLKRHLVDPLVEPVKPYANAASQAVGSVVQSAPVQRVVEDFNRAGIRREMPVGPTAELARASGMAPGVANNYRPETVAALNQPAPTALSPLGANTRADRIGSPTEIRRVGGNATAENLGILPPAAGMVQPGLRQQPMRAGETPMTPGSGWIRNETTGDFASITPDGRISMVNAAGEPISRATRPVRLDAMQGGAQQVGNLDVTFTDPNISAAQRREFLTPSPYAQRQMDAYQPVVTERIPGRPGEFKEFRGQSVEEQRLAAVQRAQDLAMLDAKTPMEKENIQSQIGLRNAQTKLAEAQANTAAEAKNIVTLKRTDEFGNSYDTFFNKNTGTLFNPVTGEASKVGGNMLQPKEGDVKMRDGKKYVFSAKSGKYEPSK